MSQTQKFLFHVGWPVGPGTSPGKIIPSLNLNMHMCSTCTGQNNNHIIIKWNMGIFRAGARIFRGRGLEQNVTTARDSVEAKNTNITGIGLICNYVCNDGSKKSDQVKDRHC